MWYNCHPKWTFLPVICVIFVYQIAVPDLVEAAKDADIYIFVIPHQFLPKVCDQMKAVVKPTALGVSLIKVFNLVFYSMFFLTSKAGAFYRPLPLSKSLWNQFFQNVLLLKNDFSSLTRHFMHNYPKVA